jgi:inhibitor of KinA
MIKNISNLGDAALYCDFGNEVSKEINSDVIKYFNTIKENNIKGVNNLTPSYNKLIISYDLKITNFKEIKQEIEKLNQSKSRKTISKNLEIPVCCDKSFSLDLERLEKKLNLKREQILENFFNKEFFCYMTGFIAGMPFLGDLDEQMRAQRLETPRVKVPKGSVGMTEQFANIYTFESPGGWNIIGNTPLEVFDSSKEINPNLINPGDTVKFKQITLEEYKNYNEQQLF